MDDEFVAKGIDEFNCQAYSIANIYFERSKSNSLEYYYYYGLCNYYLKNYSKAVGCLYQLNYENSVKEVLIESFLRLNNLDQIVKLYKLNNIDDYINGLTLLFRSVRCRIFDMIIKLLKYGADPYKICDNIFKTPINYAMIYNDFEMIETLVLKV